MSDSDVQALAERGGDTTLEVPDKVLAVLNGIPGLVGYWDRDLRNHFANDAYREYFGRAPGEMAGMHIREVLGEEVFVANLPFMQAALAGEEQLFDRTLVDVEGRTRFTQASYIADSRDGMVHGFFVLVTDVTPRVVAERALQATVAQYRALAGGMPSGFVLGFDEDLRFIIADGPELEAFGFTREDLEGRLMSDAFPPALAAEVGPRFRAALDGRTDSWQLAVGRRTFKLQAGPVRHEGDGDARSGMVTATDITAERTKQRTLSALLSIATDVARHSDPEIVARGIASAMVDLFEVDSAAAMRFTGERSAEILSMVPEMVPGLSRHVTFAPDETSATAQVLATGRPAFVRYPAAPGQIADRMTTSGVRAGLAAPVRHDGVLWGAIGLLSNTEDHLDGLLEELAAFAELLEVAVGTTTAWDMLSREARTDLLTGLHNRRAFDSCLSSEVGRAVRHGHPLTVAVLDLDRFKSVNDTWGHATGDSVLRELGQRMTAQCRDGELIARVGGEEFGWVLPGVDGDDGERAAERLRAAVSATPFDDIGTVTLSIGVATLSDLEAAAGADELLAAADRALYAAKRAGRDRVSRDTKDLRRDVC